jgi:hypothetical protein
MLVGFCASLLVGWGKMRGREMGGERKSCTLLGMEEEWRFLRGEK